MADMVSNGGAWSLESGMRVNPRLNLLWNFVTLLNLLEPPPPPPAQLLSLHQSDPSVRVMREVALKI